MSPARPRVTVILNDAVAPLGRLACSPGGRVGTADGVDRLVLHSWHGDTSFRGVNVLPLEWTDGRPSAVLP